MMEKGYIPSLDQDQSERPDEAYHRSLEALRQHSVPPSGGDTEEIQWMTIKLKHMKHICRKLIMYSVYFKKHNMHCLNNFEMKSHNIFKQHAPQLVFFELS